MDRPGIGVGVTVWRDGKFLLMKRLGSHGSGKWATPAGKLGMGESWEECGIREETGMEIKNVRFLAVTNDIFTKEGKHYVAIWLEADWASGEPKIMEPDKCTAIGWYTYKDMPKPLLEPTWQNLRKLKPDLFT